ncbi:MAG: PP2C family protein-serine/threonine phosphatase [Wujia sp.]
MIEVAEITGRGGRTYNEDTVRVERRDDAVCVIVADGLGSCGGGEIASKCAADIVMQQFLNNQLHDRQDVEEAFHLADSAVKKQQTQECEMKTTMAMLLLENNEALRAHVGDTRIYRFRNAELFEQTLDHSVSQMAVLMNEISQSQIRFHDDRSKVLRALGSDSAEPEVSGPVKLEKEKGFHAFLLCTDGFWEYVYESEMAAILKQAHTPEEWLQGMLLHLEKRAPKNNDNFTAAAVFVA